MTVLCAQQCIDRNRPSLLSPGEPSNLRCGMTLRESPASATHLPLRFDAPNKHASHLGADLTGARGMEMGEEHNPPFAFLWVRTTNLLASNPPPGGSEYHGQPHTIPSPTDAVHRRRGRASCDLCRRMKVRSLDSCASKITLTYILMRLRVRIDPMRQRWRQMLALPSPGHTMQCNACREEETQSQEVSTSLLFQARRSWSMRST